MSNTLVRGSRIEKLTLHVVMWNHFFSKFTINSEANVSELLEYLEKMYPCY